jgi:hypothetical protein
MGRPFHIEANYADDLKSDTTTPVWLLPMVRSVRSFLPKVAF